MTAGLKAALVCELNNCSGLGQISNIEVRCSWILLDAAADLALVGLDEFNGMAPKIMLGWKGGALLNGTKDEN